MNTIVCATLEAAIKAAKEFPSLPAPEPTVWDEFCTPEGDLHMHMVRAAGKARMDAEDRIGIVFPAYTDGCGA
jgi:hypothetical protein